MGMREDIRNGKLSPSKALDILKRSGRDATKIINWITTVGEKRFARALDAKVRAEEAMRRAMDEKRVGRVEGK